MHQYPTKHAPTDIKQRSSDTAGRHSATNQPCSPCRERPAWNAPTGRERFCALEGSRLEAGQTGGWRKGLCRSGGRKGFQGACCPDRRWCRERGSPTARPIVWLAFQQLPCTVTFPSVASGAADQVCARLERQQQPRLGGAPPRLAAVQVAGGKTSRRTGMLSAPQPPAPLSPPPPQPSKTKTHTSQRTRIANPQGRQATKPAHSVERWGKAPPRSQAAGRLPVRPRPDSVRVCSAGKAPAQPGGSPAA
jgi:hypothetical protein